MQQSSMVLFCSQCGLANDPTATHCSFCQHTLVALAPPPEEQFPAPPIVVTPPALQQIPADHSSLLNQKRGPVDVQRGTILSGKYRIEEEIGQGGFSLVYRGKELGSKRQVAIKRIPLSALTTRQIIDATETFNREFLMLSRFGGLRGIPKLYQKLADAENWYLIMEYIEGQTLEEYLRAAPGGYLPEEEVAKIGEELAHMLQTLHFSQPFAIFRDVKPANIMITPRGKLYLIDFGIARFFTPGKTKDTTPFGSPGYASPEQYGRAQTDQRADIYSLGATLQTLLTGRDPQELAQGETSLNPDSPSPGLRGLLDQMLNPEPERRPPDLRKVQYILAPYQSPIPSYRKGIVGAVLASVALLVFAFFTIPLRSALEGVLGGMGDRWVICLLGLYFVSIVVSLPLGMVGQAATLARQRQETSRARAFGCILLVLFAGGLFAILFAFAQLFF